MITLGRVLIMLAVFFTGFLSGIFFLGILSACMIDEGDMIIYVRDGEGFNRLLADEEDHVK